MISEPDAKTKARSLESQLSRRDTFAVLTGILLLGGLDFFNVLFFKHPDPWIFRGSCIPIMSITWLLVLISSTSMQSSLKKHGAPDPVKNREGCAFHLYVNGDDEGLRLLRGIAMAGSLYGMTLGGAIALGVSALVLR